MLLKTIIHINRLDDELEHSCYNIYKTRKKILLRDKCKLLPRK